MPTKEPGASARQKRSKDSQDPAPVLNQMFGDHKFNDPNRLKKTLKLSLEQPDTVHGAEEQEEEEGAGENLVSTDTPPEAVTSVAPASSEPALRTESPQPAEAPATQAKSTEAAPSASAAEAVAMHPGTAATASATEARTQVAPSVNITVNLTKPQQQRLNKVAALEQIRFERKVSASEVLRHLVDFALAHVEGDLVLPDDAGNGLKLPEGR